MFETKMEDSFRQLLPDSIFRPEEGRLEYPVADRLTDESFYSLLTEVKENEVVVRSEFVLLLAFNACKFLINCKNTITVQSVDDNTHY
jgi:hypothetical protein